MAINILKKNIIHRERKHITPILNDGRKIFIVYKLGKNISINKYFNYDVKTSTIFVIKKNMEHL